VRKKQTKEEYILEKLSHLSALRDLDQFELSLLESLTSLFKLNQVTMYKIFEIHQGFCTLIYNKDVPSEEITLKKYANKKLTNISQLPESIKSACNQLSDDNMLSIEKVDDGIRYIIQSEHSSESLAFLDFVSKTTLNKKDIRLLESLLTITQNFFDLLEDSQFDNLTGLLNRTTFDNNIYKIQKLHLNATHNTVEYKGVDHRKSADDCNYCLAILDIDHFKKVNDKFGHIYGDEVLLLLAQIMKKSFRADDLLFRFGGEEFVVIIHIEDLNMAYNVLERFRKTVEDYPFPQLKKVTISIGATRLEKFYRLPEDIVDRADKALYYAKEHGRNKLFFYESLVENKLLSKEFVGGEIDYF